jgi:hypothetical protein
MAIRATQAKVGTKREPTADVKAVGEGYNLGQVMAVPGSLVLGPRPLAYPRPPLSEQGNQLRLLLTGRPARHPKRSAQKNDTETGETHVPQLVTVSYRPNSGVLAGPPQGIAISRAFTEHLHLLTRFSAPPELQLALLRSIQKPVTGLVLNVYNRVRLPWLLAPGQPRMPVFLRLGSFQITERELHPLATLQRLAHLMEDGMQNLHRLPARAPSFLKLRHKICSA